MKERRRILLDDGTVGEIVWSGDTPAKNGGKTKGELLGPYDTPKGHWQPRKRARRKHRAMDERPQETT